MVLTKVIIYLGQLLRIIGGVALCGAFAILCITLLNDTFVGKNFSDVMSLLYGGSGAHVLGNFIRHKFEQKVDS